MLSVLQARFITALKDVSVTIPQAVKRGSNALLTCNYDMENDTLYSVKWYKGRREFYRYTPKENPAMKVFPSQSGLNVETDFECLPIYYIRCAITRMHPYRRYKRNEKLTTFRNKCMHIKQIKQIS
uniref:Ig-like domain-containing protein n=1 Tax=Glossina austeni TaxID=7395 RepID=A0A1A9VNS7_GLOAU